MKTSEVEARGFTFTALSDGPEDGPLLILLHGLPRNSWEWHHQIPPMAAMGFHTVAPDLRGYCPGARPEGVAAYHVNEYAEDILEIADQLGGAGAPFHLMGTSIGAPIAWWLLRDAAGLVWSLDASHALAPGAELQIVRNGQPMSLNNGGDEISLLDDQGVVRDRFSYAASSEGTIIETGHR